MCPAAVRAALFHAHHSSACRTFSHFHIHSIRALRTLCQAAPRHKHPTPYKTSPQTAAALAEALATNNSLEILSLSDNYLGEKGALALADALSKNTSIKRLSIKGNELGDAGVTAICDALLVRVMAGL